MAICAAIVAPGCGTSGETEYVVRGQVTYQGSILQGGTINFFPEKGKPLGGPIQQDGGYEYRLPAGEYRVAIRANTESTEDWAEGSLPPSNFRSLLPATYARPDTSDLSVTVIAQDEPNIQDFQLP